MSKELPSVYANPIDKKINNSQELFYGRKERSIKTSNIEEEINNIFSSPNHVYKTRVIITTDTDNIECDVVGKTSNSLLTLDNKRISIKDIKSITKK